LASVVAGHSVGIIDLGRIARGLDELAEIASHGPLRKAHGSSVLIAAKRADHALDDAIASLESLAAHQSGAASGVAQLRAATTHLDTAIGETAAKAPWPRRFMPFLSRGWDARAAAAEFRAGAENVRSAEAQLAHTPGVHRYDEATSSLVLRGEEREQALRDAAARAGREADAEALPPNVARYVDVADMWPRQQAVQRVLDAVRGLHRTTYTGAEHIPASGGAIVLGTHGSYADPILVGAGIPRETHYMADKVVARLLGGFGARRGVYPVDRAGGPAAEAAKQVTSNLLQDGKVVHMYPYGGVVRLKSTMPELKAGAAVFGLTEGVPVVPGASFGLQPRFARWDIPGSGRHVVFDEPIIFRHTPNPTAAQVDEAREIIAQRTERLLQEAEAQFRAAG
jgi:1-acyl-sn-glycerol-3-phosphate acyltransferase